MLKTLVHFFNPLIVTVHSNICKGIGHIQMAIVSSVQMDHSMMHQHEHTPVMTTDQLQLHHQHHAPLLADVSALDLGGFISIFNYSLLLSLHCIVMCTPLVCTLLGPKCHFKNREPWLYNLGRGLFYGLAGMVLGYIGAVLSAGSEVIGFYLSWSLGLILIIIAAGYWLPVTLLPKAKKGILSGRSTEALVGFVQRLRARHLGLASFALGGLTVLLPCMTLTPTLALAATSGSALKGLVTMLAFFLGTFPAMLLGPSLSTALLQKLSVYNSRRIASLFLALAGIITILRIYHH